MSMSVKKNALFICGCVYLISVSVGLSVYIGLISASVRVDASLYVSLYPILGLFLGGWWMSGSGCLRLCLRLRLPY